MTDFIPGRAVIDAAQPNWSKTPDRGPDRNGPLSDMGCFPFLSLLWGELEEDAITLLKRIRKFSMALDIRARAAIHIFHRINFAIARGVRAQIVSRLPSNLL
ncbi:hypothetical protein Tco_0986781 [Tanacetum coccineum]